MAWLSEDKTRHIKQFFQGAVEGFVGAPPNQALNLAGLRPAG
jgi:hypothetical protein